MLHYGNGFDYINWHLLTNFAYLLSVCKALALAVAQLYLVSVLVIMLVLAHSHMLLFCIKL